MKRSSLLFCSAALALTGAAAHGQSPPLAELIPSLFDRTIVLAATGHQAHFLDSSAGLREAGRQINASILSQITTFPVSSSAGGFTFHFDPALGVATRSTESFGPIFAERAETIGKGKWNVSVKQLSFDYDSIDGLELERGDLALSFTHLDTNGDGTTVETVYEGDLVLAAARLALSSQTTVLSANVGLADRFDLSVTVPLVRVELAATLETHIERLATEGLEDPPAHLFADGSDSAAFRATGSADGVGDILLRGKWQALAAEGRGLALALDLRLPTGDEEDLLGTGATQARLTVIGSGSFGRFAPHANLSYAVYQGDDGPAGELPDEAGFTAGFDWALHPRVTLAADLLWRTLFDANQLQADHATHLYKPHGQTAIQSYQRPVLETERDDLNLLSTSIGVKVNLWSQVLATVNLLAVHSDDGLTDEDLIPLFALEYSF